jgi:hypothetical protein
MNKRPFTIEDIGAELAKAHVEAFVAARLAAEIFDDGNGDPRLAMVQLARSFPVLFRDGQDLGERGVDPWDPEKLWAWANSGRESHTATDAAAFVLSIQNNRGPWAPVDLVRAWGTWDPGQRGAALGWLSAPWWPPLLLA